MNIQDILQTYSNVFSINTIVAYILREIGWMFIKLLAFIVDGLSGVTDQLFNLDMFFNNKNVVTFINSFKLLIPVLFGISFVIIGYQILFEKNKQYKKIVINFALAVALILVLPSAMSKMNSLTDVGIKAVKGNPSNLANQIIKGNITDLLVYDKLNFNKNAIDKLLSENNIKTANIRYVDATAVIKPDLFNTLGIKNEETFQNKLTMGKDGEITTEELSQGLFTISKEYYYRYSINYFNIMLSLIVTGITLFFTCFKLGRMIFELAFNKLLAILTAPLDVANGQRTKQIVQNIISIFAVSFIIAVLLEFYVLFIEMCSKKQGMVYLILMVSGSFAVIDGPNIVEKLFGIDAGLQSGFKTMMGAWAAGKAAMAGGKTVASLAMNAGKTVGGMVSQTGKTFGGTADKLADSLYKSMDKKLGPKSVKSPGGSTNTGGGLSQKSSSDISDRQGEATTNQTTNGDSSNTGNVDSLTNEVGDKNSNFDESHPGDIGGGTSISTEDGENTSSSSGGIIDSANSEDSATADGNSTISSGAGENEDANVKETTNTNKNIGNLGISNSSSGPIGNSENPLNLGKASSLGNSIRNAGINVNSPGEMNSSQSKNGEGASGNRSNVSSLNTNANYSGSSGISRSTYNKPSDRMAQAQGSSSIYVDMGNKGYNKQTPDSNISKDNSFSGSIQNTDMDSPIEYTESSSREAGHNTSVGITPEDHNNSSHDNMNSTNNYNISEHTRQSSSESELIDNDPGEHLISSQEHNTLQEDKFNGNANKADS